MKLINILTLRGPNYWSRRSVIEAWVDLGPELDAPSTSFPGFYARLTAWLPSLIEHRCSVGERGGFLQRLEEGTYPAHVLEHVAVELQNLAGTRVGFGKARETSTPHVYKVAVRYQVEALARASLATARELVMAAIHGGPFDVAAQLAPLRELADRYALGPSTSAIVAAAEARNIPARRLNEGSLVQLGQGARQRRVWTAETDRTSAVAEYIAKDKELTKRLLKEVGVPVPEGRAVESQADAWEAACEVGLPVVVKPRDGNHGRAVFVELSTQAQIERAYLEAKDAGNGVIVERFVPGREYRLLVVGRRVIAAAGGETAYVTGDGLHTIVELIELQLNTDPRRGPGDECPLNPVELDGVSRLDLERQGYLADSIPPAGVRVLIQRNGNVAFDVTDEVHPEVAALVVLAARVVGLDVAGVDVVAEDIARPLAAQGGAVVEVNSSPGLHPHLRPAVGTPRPVGEAIVELLYAQGDSGRIPLACVTGTNGKTTVSRLLAGLFSSSSLTVGLACSDGLFVGPRRLERGDRADATSAERLLLHPAVDVAVLEASHASILTEGLGFDRCSVAVVTNLGDADHLGHHFIDGPDDMFAVKRCPVDMVLPTGTAVLKADDPLVLRMAPLCQGAVLLFSQHPEDASFCAHVAAGKRGATVRDGHVVLVEDGQPKRVIALGELPLTRGGQVELHVENVLAATAAAWAMGLHPEALGTAWRRLVAAGACVAPGRFEVFEAAGATVVVDDCRNPSALAAVLRSLASLRAERRTAVFSAGHARSDAQLVHQGELLAPRFDEVVLYDDPSAKDRPPGQARALLKQGLVRTGRGPKVVERPMYTEAVDAALGELAPGGLLLIQAEEASTDLVLARVRRWAEESR